MIVVNFDTETDVDALLPALNHPDLEVIVVDNASARLPAVDAPNARLLPLPTNVGWAAGCNAGAAQARAAVLAFVNPDCRPTAADLLALADYLAEPGVGAVAPRFVNTDGSPQAFYFRFPRPLGGLFCFLPAGQRIDQWLGRPFIRHRTYRLGADLPRDVDQPGAACLLVRRDDFSSVAGFDERMFLFFADTDLCRRLRDRGLQVRIGWHRPVVHVGGASVKQLPQATLREHLQHDYVVYLRTHFGAVAVVFTKLAAIVLSGLLPALWQLVRLRPRAAVTQVRTTLRMLAA